jgi:hypothetical protein
MPLTTHFALISGTKILDCFKRQVATKQLALDSLTEGKVNTIND